MFRRTSLAVCLALAVAVGASAARAADGSVPMYVPVQGRLLDANDAPVTGQLAMTFSIYDIPETPTGSSPTPPLWSATYQVSLNNGLYAVQLGDTSTGQKPLPGELFDGSAARWLGVTVGSGVELKPRLRVASVPFALLAQRSLHAEDSKTLQGETPASLRDASKLTGILPASALGTGSTGLTTLGTITAGTWNGTPLDDAYVAGAAKWDAKLDAVAHDGSIAGDGKATPLSVVYGTTAGTAAAGNDARFGLLDQKIDQKTSALDAKFANYLPLSGGALTGSLTTTGLTNSGTTSLGGNLGVGGVSQFQETAYFQKGVSITGNASASGNGGFGGNLNVTGNLTIGGALASGDLSAGTVRGTMLASNRSYVGLEHDILLNATNKYTVTQTGPAPINLPGIFDGAYDPQYSNAAPTAASPQVIQIDGLPGVHVQAGAVIGWSTRYWAPSKFKIEIWDVQSGRNVWKTVADVQNNTAFDYVSPIIGDAVVTKIRFTIYESAGDQGKFGISELFFLHAEVSAPYANLIPHSEAYLGALANAQQISANGSGMLKFAEVQNSASSVFETQADGTLKIKRAGTIQATFTADCISNASYCTMGVLVNGNGKLQTLSPGLAGVWTQLTATLVWKAAAGDVISASVGNVKSMDSSFGNVNVLWDGLE